MLSQSILSGQSPQFFITSWRHTPRATLAFFDIFFSSFESDYTINKSYIQFSLIANWSHRNKIWVNHIIQFIIVFYNFLQKNFIIQLTFETIFYLYEENLNIICKILYSPYVIYICSKIFPFEILNTYIHNTDKYTKKY